MPGCPALCFRRDRPLHRQVGQEPLNVLNPQTLGRCIATERQEPLTPIHIGLLGADGILHRPNGPGQGLEEREAFGGAGKRGTRRRRA